MMNLENTKVYTTDPEVIRKYAELCGVTFNNSSHEEYTSRILGVSFPDDRDHVDWFSESSRANRDNDQFKTIALDQINALYDEKFGKVETPEEAEAFESMAQVNEQLQNHEMGERIEWKNGDECVVSDEKFNVVLGCEKYIGQNGKVIGTHTNELGYHLAFIEFDDGACFAFRIEMLRKPETPQQREERERLEEIDKMSKIVEMKNGSAGNAYKKYCTALYDAGYRKQKDGE